MAYALDTHAAVRELTAAGLETPAAEAIVAVIARADSGLATRADPAVTKSDLAVAKSDIETAIARAGNRMLLAQLAIAGLLFAAIRLFT